MHKHFFNFLGGWVIDTQGIQDTCYNVGSYLFSTAKDCARYTKDYALRKGDEIDRDLSTVGGIVGAGAATVEAMVTLLYVDELFTSNWMWSVRRDLGALDNKGLFSKNVVMPNGVQQVIAPMIAGTTTALLAMVAIRCFSRAKTARERIAAQGQQSLSGHANVLRR